MSIVLDASLTLTWYFEDERTAGVDARAGQHGQQLVVVLGLEDVDATLTAGQPLGDERDAHLVSVIAVVVRKAKVVTVTEAAELARELFDHGIPS